MPFLLEFSSKNYSSSSSGISFKILLENALETPLGISLTSLPITRVVFPLEIALGIHLGVPLGIHQGIPLIIPLVISLGIMTLGIALELPRVYFLMIPKQCSIKKM